MIIPIPNQVIKGAKIMRVKELECEAQLQKIVDLVIPDSGKTFTKSGMKYRLLVIFEQSTNSPEEYRLSVKCGTITITANDNQGVFYALQSLKQLIENQNMYEVEIIDAPKYHHRGVLIDCARHFFELDVLKRKIDLMAALKLNVLHWHLTDDQGFRIEIDKYPLLNMVSSTRSDSLLLDGYNNKVVSGYYTKQQIRELVAYAKERYVEIIPEFDIPGHFISIIAAYPQLSCEQVSIDVPNTFGVHKPIACVGQDLTLKFIKDILDEMIELFPATFFHIGGDEAPKDRWKSCDLCQTRIKELGLTDENHLQSWLMNEVAKYLKSKGKKAIGWNDGINKHNSLDLVCQHWYDGDKMTNTIREVNSGREVIISDARYLYFDAPDYITTLKKTYQFKLHNNNFNQDAKILGGEVAIWTEYIENEYQLDRMLCPRIYAGSEVFWSTSKTSYFNFKQRLNAVTKKKHNETFFVFRLFQKYQYKYKQNKVAKIQNKINK